MKTRALWIVGTPFSGSTLLQFQLSRFESVFLAGELDRLRLFGMHPHLEADPRFYLDYCAYCRAHECRCPIWNAGTLERLEKLGPTPRIYEVLAEISGQAVILDSSKTPWWFQNITAHRDFTEWQGRIFVIYSIRNPFAFAASYSRRTGASLESSVLHWVLINRDAVNVVQNAQGFIPTLVAYHNKILTAPEAFLSTVRSWLGLGEPRCRVDIVNHFLGGNVSAYPFAVPAEQSNEFFDDTMAYFRRTDAVADDDSRWRAVISPNMRIRLASLPGVRDLCLAAGINLDGLIFSQG